MYSCEKSATFKKHRINDNFTDPFGTITEINSDIGEYYDGNVDDLTGKEVYLNGKNHKSKGMCIGLDDSANVIVLMCKFLCGGDSGGLIFIYEENKIRPIGLLQQYSPNRESDNFGNLGYCASFQYLNDTVLNKWCQNIILF